MRLTLKALFKGIAYLRQRYSGILIVLPLRSQGDTHFRFPVRRSIMLEYIRPSDPSLVPQANRASTPIFSELPDQCPCSEVSPRTYKRPPGTVAQ